MNMLTKESTLLLGFDKPVLNPSELNLAATVLDQECRVLLLTAPTSGCGTTTSAQCLARQLAQTAKGKVLLVDADTSGNGISARLGMGADPGLFELLLSEAPEKHIDEYVQRISGQTFDLLPLGQPDNAAGHFTAEDMEWVLSCLSAQYRFVVIDSEAVYSSSNALGLAALADGVILVVRAETTRWEVAQAAVERLRQANAKLLGSVFNARRFYIPKWLYNLL